ncbi:tumor necrosis factor receptor superfamily member 8 isoform D [Patagioenas fasciata monilis]|uniref:Tumor necrosis factor receptor superfamily member 8 isoform D n=1 Tax=Patagioenas fasciata monilis TaxID=372326 RepID=A0A1V4KP55_PATFA|nr:tumor necrosis factor receptor superfamily member 8 isoform D [Patagioenas fasciata monilis]
MDSFCKRTGARTNGQSSCFPKCTVGSVKKKACPRNPDEDCMRCGPEQYVKERFHKPQCAACVSCAKEPDLVETKPCSFNSSRECECRPGLFCQMSVTYTCLRCQQHTVCKPGFGVKVRGTSSTDVICEKCPPGTFSNENSSTDICKPHTNCAKLNKVALSKGNATHDQVCLDQLPTYLTPSTLSMKFSNERNNSNLRRFEENLVTVAGIVLSAATMENPSSTPEEKVPAGTFPTSAKGETTMAVFSHLHSIASHKSCLGSQGSDLVNEYTIRLTADREPEEKEFIDRTLPLETNNNLFSSTEKACSPDLSLTDMTESDGNAPDRPVDSRLRDHTNNQIEKIYIMNADTVIVGSILGAPSGKNCAARGCESNVDAQENVEEELVMHYPEQETESFPGNDVMIPVEEEGKEFHHPTAATEK